MTTTEHTRRQKQEQARTGREALHARAVVAAAAIFIVTALAGCLGTPEYPDFGENMAGEWSDPSDHRQDMDHDSSDSSDASDQNGHQHEQKAHQDDSEESGDGESSSDPSQPDPPYGGPSEDPREENHDVDDDAKAADEPREKKGSEKTESEGREEDDHDSADRLHESAYRLLYRMDEAGGRVAPYQQNLSGDDVGDLGLDLQTDDHEAPAECTEGEHFRVCFQPTQKIDDVVVAQRGDPEDREAQIDAGAKVTVPVEFTSGRLMFEYNETHWIETGDKTCLEISSGSACVLHPDGDTGSGIQADLADEIPLVVPQLGGSYTYGLERFYLSQAGLNVSYEQDESYCPLAECPVEEEFVLKKTLEYSMETLDTTVVGELWRADVEIHVEYEDGDGSLELDRTLRGVPYFITAE